MSGCCGQNRNFDGVSASYKRRLWAVIAINAGMFAPLGMAEKTDGGYTVAGNYLFGSGSGHAD